MMKRWMAMGMALCLTAASLAGCSGTKDAAEARRQRQKPAQRRRQPRRRQRKNLIWIS